MDQPVPAAAAAPEPAALAVPQVEMTEKRQQHNYKYLPCVKCGKEEKYPPSLPPDRAICVGCQWAHCIAQMGEDLVPAKARRMESTHDSQIRAMSMSGGFRK